MENNKSSSFYVLFQYNILFDMLFLKNYITFQDPLTRTCASDIDFQDPLTKMCR